MNHDEFEACVNEVMDSLPLPERGVDYAGELPDVIYMFRLPHLEMGLPLNASQGRMPSHILARRALLLLNR